MRKLLLAFILPLILALSACGGGGNDEVIDTRLADAAKACKAENFYKQGQIVFSLDTESLEAIDILLADCVAEKLMSPATFAQFQASNGTSGMQTVEENGLKFGFSYNGLSESFVLTVSLVG